MIQTRKHEALYVFRRVALLALILLLLGGYNFTPSQAVRQHEQVYSLPETELSHAETIALTPLHLYRVSLSHAEDTLLLTPARFTLLRGWQKDEWAPILENAAEQSSFSYWNTIRGNRGLLVVFGYVPEGEPIPTFTVEQHKNEWDITTKDWKLHFSADLTPTALYETENGSCFVCTFRYAAPDGPSGPVRIYSSSFGEIELQ